MFLKNITKNKFITLIFISIFIMTFINTIEADPDRIERIPQGTEKIIFKQGLLPPSGIYSDLVKHLKDHGYRIMAAEEMFEAGLIDKVTDNDKLVFSAKKQISDTLAIRMKNIIKPCDTLNCGIITTTVDYATEAQAPLYKWNNAKWDGTISQKAISTTIEIFKDGGYENFKFKQ